MTWMTWQESLTPPYLEPVAHAPGEHVLEGHVQGTASGADVLAADEPVLGIHEGPHDVGAAQYLKLKAAASS